MSLVASDELQVVGSFAGAYRVGLWKNVSITAWFGKGTLPAAQELLNVTDRTVVLMAGQRVSAIYFVAEEFGLPGSEIRSVLLHLTKTYSHHVGCVAVVLAGTGFWLSAMRSFVTGLRVLAPRTFDLRVHGRAEDLLAWLPAEHFKRTGVEIDLAAFGRILEQAKSWQEQGRAKAGS